MAVTEITDSILKGIINVRDGETRDLLGVSGFTIVDRDAAFPGIYDFDHGNSFVERAYRGEVSAVDYPKNPSIDELTELKEELGAALGYTLKNVLPSYISSIPGATVPIELEEIASVPLLDKLISSDPSIVERIKRALVTFSYNRPRDPEDESESKHTLEDLVRNIIASLRRYDQVCSTASLFQRDSSKVDPNYDDKKTVRDALLISAMDLGSALANYIVLSSKAGEDPRAAVADVKAVLSLGAGAESPALADFVQDLSFVVDISNTYTQSAEDAILACLTDCAVRVARLCGVEYNYAQRPGNFIYRMSVSVPPETSEEILDMASTALNECFDIVDSALS